MKKLIMLVCVMLLMSSLAMGDDSKEILTLKRDLAQERVARLQAQLIILQQQFAEGQKYLQEVQKELKELDVKLKAMEPKVEEKRK